MTDPFRRLAFELGEAIRLTLIRGVEDGCERPGPLEEADKIRLERAFSKFVDGFPHHFEVF